MTDWKNLRRMKRAEERFSAGRGEAGRGRTCLLMINPRACHAALWHIYFSVSLGPPGAFSCFFGVTFNRRVVLGRGPVAWPGVASREWLPRRRPGMPACSLRHRTTPRPRRVSRSLLRATMSWWRVTSHRTHGTGEGEGRGTLTHRHAKRTDTQTRAKPVFSVSGSLLHN